MAVVLSCDRCGAVYHIPERNVFKDPVPTGIRFEYRELGNIETFQGTEQEFDLCPDCMKQLKKFLEIESEDGNGED